jgi:hypothetical protein
VTGFAGLNLSYGCVVICPSGALLTGLFSLICKLRFSVIASGAKQSILLSVAAMDCFASLAMT